MTNRIFTDRDGACWTRVSKRRAISAYEAGNDVIITPVYVDPFNMWRPHARVSNKRRWGVDVTFDSIVNEYEYYNCNSNEVGRYPAYYVRTEVLE